MDSVSHRSAVRAQLLYKRRSMPPPNGGPMRIHALAAVALFSAAASAALPRGVLPMRPQADRVVSAAAAAAPANVHLNYYGGHVISNVHVIPVMWGSNVPSAVATGMAPFYSAVTDSPYFDFLAEYDTSIADYAGNAG